MANCSSNNLEVSIINCGPAYACGQDSVEKTVARNGITFKQVFKPELITKETAEEEIPTSFEDKADVYVKGEAEIQKLIQEAKEREARRRSLLCCITNFGPIKVNEEKIRDDYAKKHPAYAAVRKEMEFLKEKHDAEIKKEIAKFDRANRYSGDDPILKNAKRLVFIRYLHKI